MGRNIARRALFACISIKRAYTSSSYSHSHSNGKFLLHVSLGSRQDWKKKKRILITILATRVYAKYTLQTFLNLLPGHFSRCFPNVSLSRPLQREKFLARVERERKRQLISDGYCFRLNRKVRSEFLSLGDKEGNKLAASRSFFSSLLWVFRGGKARVLERAA